MARIELLDPDLGGIDAEQRAEALSLAAAMPRLVVAARRAAQTVVHGLHGRRRAGTGENFWQFRRFSAGEARTRIDWRRSARDEHLYVREQEWEAAHTIWIWIDRSQSMAYRSSLAQSSKLERAVTLGLALADILVRGGERVGLLGLTRPTSSRNAVDRLAEALCVAPPDANGLPAATAPIARLSEAVLISDLLAPSEDVAATVADLAARGGRGHLVSIADPVEETFPFSGRTEFRDPDGAFRLTAGRAEDYRADYERRLARHRAEVTEAARRRGWSSLLHRTDRPATEALLALHTRLAEVDSAA